MVDLVFVVLKKSLVDSVKPLKLMVVGSLGILERQGLDSLTIHQRRTFFPRIGPRSRRRGASQAED